MEAHPRRGERAIKTPQLRFEENQRTTRGVGGGGKEKGGGGGDLKEGWLSVGIAIILGF